MRRCPAILAVIASASLTAAPACSPDESSSGEALALGDVPRDLPLTAVTGVAASPRGLVVGGVSTDTDLFWDAWFVPADGRTPWRLAPVGNSLVSTDAAGALWTAITDFGPAGRPTYETRLSSWDGSPSVPLSVELPPEFSAERAVSDGEGGWLLAGSEDVDGATRGSVIAVDARGHVRRLPCDLGPEAPLFLDAVIAPDVLQLTIQHAPEGPAFIVNVPRR